MDFLAWRLQLPVKSQPIQIIAKNAGAVQISSILRHSYLHVLHLRIRKNLLAFRDNILSSCSVSSAFIVTSINLVSF